MPKRSGENSISGSSGTTDLQQKEIGRGNLAQRISCKSSFAQDSRQILKYKKVLRMCATWFYSDDQQPNGLRRVQEYVA